MTFRKILVAVDFSSCSLAALYKALSVAEDVGASLDVLHVQRPAGSGDQSAYVEAERQLQDLIEEAQHRLGVRLNRRIELGDPLQRIIQVASEGDYDLIVMGTHGRVGRLRMLMGSIAEGVVRNAPCPVLTVRLPDGEEETFKERVHRRPAVARQH